MLYLYDHSSIEPNIDIEKLKYVFINIVGNDFDRLLTAEQITEIIETFLKYKFNDLITKENYVKQFHVLYLIGNVLCSYNQDNLHLDNDVFYEEVYYPNMVSILSSHLRDARKKLYTIIRTTFNSIYNKNHQVVDFYSVLFNSDHLVLQNDIINIFLNTLFLDTDPLDLDDLKDFYYSTFKYLIYSYLKNKTTGLISFEIEPSIFQQEYSMSTSVRFKIYEDGIRITQIQELCSRSITHDRIIENYNKLKGNIITNELQRFYLSVINKSVTTNHKVSVLNAIDSEEELNKIKKKLPLIYKLLRALHISNKQTYIDDQFKTVLCKSIYEVLFNEFKKHLIEEASATLANNISKKLTQSLTNGQYIDPLTMDKISINTYPFINQLKEFLAILIRRN